MKAPDLIALVGPEAARKIVEAYGGAWERVPPLRSYEIAMRNSLILHLHRDGMEPRRIAWRAGCSVGVVKATIRNAKSMLEGIDRP